MTTFTPQLATTNTDGTEKNSPKPINSGDAAIAGQPTTPGTAAGSLKNTTLDKMNSSLAHVCDITGPLVYGIAWAAFKIGEAIQAIRTFLEGLWGSVASSPFGDAVRGAIKFIKAKIALAMKFLKQVQEAVAAVQKFINVTLNPTKVIKSTQLKEIETPYIVTYATRDFLPSLNQFIISFGWMNLGVY